MKQAILRGVQVVDILYYALKTLKKEVIKSEAKGVLIGG